MKSNIPLILLKTVQPIVDENVELVTSLKDSTSFFYIKHNEHNSDFYYKIIRQENSNSKLGYIIEHKPKNQFETNKHAVWLELQQIEVSIKNWLKILEEYNKIRTVYDDPILAENEKRFQQQFEIIDEDASYSSFNLNQQIFIYDYLNNAKEILSKYKDKVDENAKPDLIELEREVLEIQMQLTNESKRKIIERLSKFWAKTQKIGLELIKEIFVSVVSDLTKKLINGG